MLAEVQANEPFDLDEVDIATSRQLEVAYRDRIPVVLVDGVEVFWFRVEAAALIRRLREAG